MQKIRQNPLLIIVVLLAVIAGAVLRFKTKKNTLQKDATEFAVADTASIDKIFIADKNKQTVTLTRSGNGWLLNGKYPARQDMVNILLNTIKKVKVKAPVPKNTVQGLLTGMATIAKKIEIYSNGQNIKTYYVAGPDMNHTGTYMLMDKSAIPYLTHIEGFEGYLTTRYCVEEAPWRDNLLFAINKKNINSVSINYGTVTNTSYMFNNNNGVYALKNIETNAPVKFDTLAINIWLNGFAGASVEGFDAGISKTKTDSALKQLPLYEVNIVHENTKKIHLKVFKLKLPPGSTDYGGNTTEYDNDRAYVLINNQLPLAVMQYAMLENIVKPLSYFTPIVKK
jgi:hypothetical protein